MKKMKMIFALLIAMVMVLGMSTAVFAAGTGTITITPPEGTQSTTTNTYKIYDLPFISPGFCETGAKISASNTSYILKYADFVRKRKYFGPSQGPF